MSITLDATEYTFQGEGITASFYPKGAGGPIIEGKPETFFVYQDHHLSKTFGQAATLVQRLVFPALQTYKVEHLDPEGPDDC